MKLFCLGLNHKTAPVEIRERLAFSETHLPENLAEIQALKSIRETVVLSTCNRVEIYASAEEPEVAGKQVTDFLIDHFEIDESEIGHIEFYEKHEADAAQHLFKVASGLDSMVLGETEIFGQVKKAYATAQSAGTTSRQLNKLFQQSFQIGKLVRSSTKIQQGSTSIGAVAVDLAEKIFGRLNGCKVMIVGAGEMSRTTAQSLLSRGASSIIVSNRSFDKAEELAAELKGEAVRFDNWEANLGGIDIIVSATGAPHTVLHAETVEHAMNQRPGRSLFVIDIAVPRDVEDQVNEIENVYLYNIDQLQQIAEEGRTRREEQIAICEEVIEKHIGEKGIPALAEQTETQPEKRKPGETEPVTG
ncbi:MAG: glutamyl-tRNA reductase [Verrucomicrobiales bacterium]|nr:glutamyl-tRNA reductase [Verrucomicrobiales bacterium]